ncbi:MAG: type II toxin-antitoxin system VapC family toxin [Thermoleophilia bacterium]
MTTLLLDSSVWLAARDSADRFHEASVEIIEGGGGPLGALDLTFYEVGTVAVRRWRSLDEARRLTELVQVATEGRIVRVDGPLAIAAASIGQEEGVSVYDAAFVAAARERGWRLVSGDLADLVSRGLAVSPEAVRDGAEPPPGR